MGRHLSPGCPVRPAAAGAETGVASANTGVVCVFPAFPRSFPDGGALKGADSLLCAAGDQRDRPSRPTWQEKQHPTSYLGPFICQSAALQAWQ